MTENKVLIKKVQRCPEITHRILLGVSLACSHHSVCMHTWGRGGFINSKYIDN